MLRFAIAIAIACLAASGTDSLCAQPAQPEPVRGQRQPPPPMPAPGGRTDRRDDREFGGEPQVRGPVHEAFAAPTIRQPTPPQSVAELPPEPPEELPPAIAPQGNADSTRWIPGYWGRDAHSQEYIWVSGTWRNAPPEMEWVPGYWANMKGECRWVPGFWAYANEGELAYLPPPPAPKEEQLAAAPDDQHFWVPGNWQYVEDRYEWKSGFWSQIREGWIWSPDCYVWSPRGHVFVRGYWDVPLEQRGILFAPISTKGRVLNYVTPTVVIDVREALAHWFVAPSYRHYCFGDYYDLDPKRANLVSWYERSALSFDSLRIYYAKHDQDRFATLKTKHAHCQEKESIRPAANWRDYGNVGAGRLAFAVSNERLPAGIVRFNVEGQQLGSLIEHYVEIMDRRAEFEQGAAIVEGRRPVFAQYENFIPPGPGGLPPGLAKKGLVPPGFGGAPPGQTKKLIESFGPIYEKAPKYKEKFGNPGGGKGKGKGKGK